MPNRSRTRGRSLTHALVLSVGLALSPSAANAQSQDTRPYDTELLRLAEMLGSIHYLRAVCGKPDGQLWRDQMVAIISAEGSSALRRVVLTRRFNRGFASYSRTHRRCTASAAATLDRLLEDAERLTGQLLGDVAKPPQQPGQ
ncbi:MAG: TIGR02301 family protein [Pseudomonadota bacterium]